MTTIAGTLHYGRTRATSAERNAYLRNKSKIIGVLPAAVRGPRMGCMKCKRLADCREDGPLCEGTILVRMNSGEVIRM